MCLLVCLTGIYQQIKDAMGNDYGRPKDVVGETRQAFTSLADTAFDVCFENTLVNSRRTLLPTIHDITHRETN